MISIHGFFGDAEGSSEQLIPFASCEPPILFIAGTDDKMCPSVKFVSKVQLFWEGHKKLHNLPHGFDVY